MKQMEPPSGVDRLLREKERYFSHIGKTLSLLTDTMATKRGILSNISTRTARLKQNRKKTLLKIRVTEKNNIIYKLNIERIRREISKLFKEAKRIKDDYDTILKGPVSEIVSFTEENGSDDVVHAESSETQSESDQYPIDDETVNMIDLEKKSFLSSIDTLFQEYENKIDELNRKKKEHSLELEKFKARSSSIKKKRTLFYTIQKTYSDEITALKAQAQKESNDLRQIEAILKEMLNRLKFSSLLDNKARPLFTISPNGTT